METDRDEGIDFPHFDGRRYFNPAAPEYGLPRLARPGLAGDAAAAAAALAEVDRRCGSAGATGHAGAARNRRHLRWSIDVSVATRRRECSTDPIWSARASPLRWAGPRRVAGRGRPSSACRPSISCWSATIITTTWTYRRCDICGGHFDPLFITGLGNRRYLREARPGRVEELDWWQSFPAPGGLTVTMTPAQHFSRRGLFDRLRSLWGGFLLTAGSKQVFFTGDSAYGAT